MDLTLYELEDPIEIEILIYADDIPYLVWLEEEFIKLKEGLQ